MTKAFVRPTHAESGPDWDGPRSFAPAAAARPGCPISAAGTFVGPARFDRAASQPTCSRSAAGRDRDRSVTELLVLRSTRKASIGGEFEFESGLADLGFDLNFRSRGSFLSGLSLLTLAMKRHQKTSSLP